MSTITAIAPSIKAPSASLGIVAALTLTIKALSEGLSAYRRYEQLRARGASHADAAARSFDA